MAENVGRAALGVAIAAIILGAAGTGSVLYLAVNPGSTHTTTYVYTNQTKYQNTTHYVNSTIWHNETMVVNHYFNSTTNQTVVIYSNSSYYSNGTKLPINVTAIYLHLNVNTTDFGPLNTTLCSPCALGFPTNVLFYVQSTLTDSNNTTAVYTGFTVNSPFIGFESVPESNHAIAGHSSQSIVMEIGAPTIAGSYVLVITVNLLEET